MIFAQAEAALDTEQATPMSSRVKATQTIAALGAEYIADSKQRSKAARTIQGRESRLNAHILPTIGDVPPIDTIIVEVPDPQHPYGVRGVGEVPICPPPAAIANAIYDAVGVRMLQLPMSPPRLLSEILKKS